MELKIVIRNFVYCELKCKSHGVQVLLVVLSVVSSHLPSRCVARAGHPRFHQVMAVGADEGKCRECHVSPCPLDGSRFRNGGFGGVSAP